jgi:hypothetical protein
MRMVKRNMLLKGKLKCLDIGTIKGVQQSAGELRSRQILEESIDV